MSVECRGGSCGLCWKMVFVGGCTALFTVRYRPAAVSGGDDQWSKQVTVTKSGVFSDGLCTVMDL
jgi:hypothetical protein